MQSLFRLKLALLVVIVVSSDLRLKAQEDFTLKEPSFTQLFGFFYDDIKAIPKYTLETDPKYLLAIAISSALTIAYDQELLDASHRLARRWGLGQNDNTEAFFSVFGFDCRFPTDFESCLYFIGDGWPHGLLVLGYGINGLLGDSRSLNIAGQFVEGLGVTAFVTQAIKHVTGRESPVTSHTWGGVWRFFPDQIKYHRNVPKYDAFPSGHLATAMTTLTLLVKNYPEYEFHLKIIGYSLFGLLGFGMMNLGVHWAGDYPLALGIGYMAGDMAYQHGKLVQGAPTSGRKHENVLLPLVSKENIGVIWSRRI